MTDEASPVPVPAPAAEEVGTTVYKLSDAERRLIQEGLDSPLVSDAEMEKFWNRHRV